MGRVWLGSLGWKPRYVGWLWFVAVVLVGAGCAAVHTSVSLCAHLTDLWPRGVWRGAGL